MRAFEHANMDIRLLETVTETLHEIGTGLAKKKLYQQAMTWLGRAYAILNHDSLQSLSLDMVELKHSVMNNIGMYRCVKNLPISV